MSLNIETKKAAVEEISAAIANAQTLVVAEYRGISVASMTELRANSRKEGVYLRVLKNTLARRAVEYDLQLGIKEKIETLATKVYGASGVAFSSKALKDISKLEALGYGKLPICVAKTQYSISDDPELFGRPDDFIMTVRGIKPSAGAGFIVVLTGDIMTMPGLPQKPAAIDIDIDECGKIKGLF